MASDHYDAYRPEDAYEGRPPGSEPVAEGGPEAAPGTPLRWHDLSREQRAVLDRRSWNRAIVFFLLTLLSTFWVGSGMVTVDAAQPAGLLDGWIFAVPLLAILLCHEFGHYIFARRHGVATSPPYFIPFPNLIGTMGAFISIRSPIHNRRQLLDIGAAGPLAGFVPSVIVLVIGYSLSTVTPLSSLPQGEPLIVLGDSLLTRFIQEMVMGPVPDGYDVMIHPVGLAGWVGLFVTMLNLLPVWMLDGGHVTYALLGRGQWRLAPLAMLGVILVGVFVESWWLHILGAWAFLYLVFVVVARLFRRSGPSLRDLMSGRFLRHFPVPNEEPVGPVRSAIGWLCVGILVLCFIPAPIRIMVVGG